MPTQTPTVGRRVWWWPEANGPQPLDEAQPFDAGVIYVHSNGRVNLACTDHVGFAFVREEVELLNERKPGCAQWMPYQQAQHAQRVQVPQNGQQAGS